MAVSRQNPSHSILTWVAESPPIARLRQAGRPIPAEDFVEEGVYVVRADIPGVDPSRDIEVSVHRGLLEIKAYRRDDLKRRQHREISYGLFRRVMRLPEDADDQTLSTRYTNGVLEVAIDLPGAHREVRPTPFRERHLSN
jgi:HSP20 family molecular chaperone IbpA